MAVLKVRGTLVMETQESTPVVEKKKLLRYLLVPMIAIDLVVVAGLVYYFGYIPRAEIKRLAKEFVSVEVNEGNHEDPVRYSIVAKKPKNWVTLKEADYTAIHALVVSEDWPFYEHSGYDVEQIKKVVGESLDEGKLTRGASTISQQVVKNLFLSNERSLWRKFNELVFTIVMERELTKEKILEIYINIIEFGPEIYGIGPASMEYFHKVAKELNPREGAFLAMLLPNPKRYSQSFREKKLSEFAQKRVDEILEKMVQAGYLKREQLGPSKEKSFFWEPARTPVPSEVALPYAGEVNESEAYKADPDLKLEAHPSFDNDAIPDDIGVDGGEFSVD
jgi:monofunctional biosynthetic peptidoglycan transglycosylase